MTRPVSPPDWATSATYSTGPYPGQPNKAPPGAALVQEGFDPQTFLPDEWLNYLLNNHGQWIDYFDTLSFSDGFDGSFVADGTATMSGAFLNGSVYTLSRDVFFQDFTVNSGVTIASNGFRIYCRGTITTLGTGLLSANGTPGNSFGGATSASGTVLGGAAGGTGGTVPMIGADSPNSFAAFNGGGSGGEGGANQSVTVPIPGGTASLPPPGAGNPRIWAPHLMGHILGLSGSSSALTALGGGAGGGAGRTGPTGPGSGGPGGGGGSGGGNLCICARALNFASPSSVIARGGDGQQGGGVNGSGGGGGGGGFVLLLYGSKNGVTFSPAVNAPGGSGAGSLGLGAKGQNGAPGYVLEVPLFQ